MDRDTLPRGGISFSHPADLSLVGNQNRMKLRVNRVAIIQELRAEHVVGYLARQGLLTATEMKQICTDQIKPVASLLDILGTKENKTQWYNHFITSLRQAEVDKNQKLRYHSLVDFLENTIITFPSVEERRAKAETRFSKYHPLPSIANQNFSKKSSQYIERRSPSEDHQEHIITPSAPPMELAPQEPLQTLISGHYHKWVPPPQNHVTKLKDQSGTYISLETHDDKIFHEQIKAEKLALHRMKELEVLHLMHRQKRLPQGFVLCLADCVIQIIGDIDNHHLYLKHFLQLKQDYNLYILRELVGSFSAWLTSTKLDVQHNADLLKRATTLGFQLFDILDECGEYVSAEAVMSVLTMWLMVQPCIDTWIHAYTACVRLARIRIRNFEFTDADTALVGAVKYLNAITMMSFGQNLVDKSEKMVATSLLMHELGNHVTSYCWAQDGMKEVSPENKAGIVRALCNATKSYASKYNIKRAHELATEAVRQAGELFGRAHPLYIKARLTYIEFITEFAQTGGDKIIKLALDTLSRCELMYNCDSMLLAHTHRVVSTAYISAHKLTGEEYLDHAWKAQRTAMNCVMGTHPILSIFAEQVARCSLIKSRVTPKPTPPPDTLAAMKATQLVFAASELSVAYRIYCPCFGTRSFRAARARVLLADILCAEENLTDAQTMYEDSLSIYEQCMSPSSPYLSELRYKLSKFYYNKGDVTEAIALLEPLLLSRLKEEGKLDAGRVRVGWMDEAFALLLKAITHLNDPERQDDVTRLYHEWLEKTEPIIPLSIQELNKKPEPYKYFIAMFNVWQKRISPKIVAAMKEDFTKANFEKFEGEILED